MTRQFPKNRPLPRPTRTEVIVMAIGVAMIGLAAVLLGVVGGGWPHLIWFAGVIVSAAGARRVAGRRLDAIRSRPPL